MNTEEVAMFFGILAELRYLCSCNVDMIRQLSDNGGQWLPKISY